jgi:phosphatidylglycerol:prolipoprotein diacylglycerol transferase
VQLLEAATSLLIAGAALTLVLTGPLPLPGALFVGAFAVYTLGRQLLFPLRAEPRRTSAG